MHGLTYRVFVFFPFQVCNTVWKLQVANTAPPPPHSPALPPACGVVCVWVKFVYIHLLHDKIKMTYPSIYQTFKESLFLALGLPLKSKNMDVPVKQKQSFTLTVYFGAMPKPSAAVCNLTGILAAPLSLYTCLFKGRVPLRELQLGETVWNGYSLSGLEWLKSQSTWKLNVF